MPGNEFGGADEVDAFERQVRATVIQTLRDTGEALSAAAIGDLLRVDASRVSAALRSLKGDTSEVYPSPPGSCG